MSGPWPANPHYHVRCIGHSDRTETVGSAGKAVHVAPLPQDLLVIRIRAGHENLIALRCRKKYKVSTPGICLGCFADRTRCRGKCTRGVTRRAASVGGTRLIHDEERYG